MSADDGDVGSASLWALSMAIVLWASVAGVVLAGVAVVARHRAATAADLAALAGAAVLARGEPAAQFESGSASGSATGSTATGSTACAAATAVALANDAVVTNCHANANVIDVTASARIPALGLLGSLGLGSVSARARAGPG